VVALVKSGWVAFAVDACNCKRRKRECAPARRVDIDKQRRRRRLTSTPSTTRLACLSDEYPGHVRRPSVRSVAPAHLSRRPSASAAILPATSPPALPPAMHATPVHTVPSSHGACGMRHQDRTRLSSCGCACASRRVHRACASLAAIYCGKYCTVLRLPTENLLCM
jgi:hypothetical protein